MLTEALFAVAAENIALDLIRDLLRFSACYNDGVRILQRSRQIYFIDGTRKVMAIPKFSISPTKLTFSEYLLCLQA
jgi:hypothetical protein